MHPHRAELADKSFLDKVAHISVVRRQPALQPDNMSYVRSVSEFNQFLRDVDVGGKGPLAVHVLASSDGGTDAVRVLGCRCKNNNEIDIGMTDEVFYRLHDVFDTVVTRDVRRCVLALTVDGGDFVLR